ncbi:protein ENHANCED DOWNY MILDEW 2-like isoform X1 [Prunus avium]|uniref:Protein ENHANCED DOWNY MILDEW 2-like isoform X1 n=1 Tax=Prunus avium TaxID=42229 RepID=A0A6P5S2J8_PRUAV|nr:protein ENHANCED DOWNY MILDEW 2-like isoform X1 [Prunus avium]
MEKKTKRRGELGMNSLREFHRSRDEAKSKDIQATEKPGFIVDHMEDYEIEVEDESNDDDDLFDSVCAFCDNGGKLLCCEGRCLRSFHATKRLGKDTRCESLGFTQDEVDAMPIFFCKNCEYKQHQCFACGKLGSSDKSSVAEVFRCVSATCGQFYHPHCIAQLVYPDNRVTAEELEKKISMGESFTCPIHKCCVCKQGENKKDPELRFAVCRRCPKSYHRKCLPSEIVTEKIEKTEEEEEEEEEEDEEVEDEEDEDIEGEDVITRGWDGLLPNRILIYCLKHEIVKRIKTPIRDHLKFPDVNEKKTGLEEKKKKRAAESVLDREKSVTKKRNLPSEEFYRGKTAHTISKQKLKSPCAVEVGGSRTTEKVPSGLDISRRVKVNSSLKKEINTSVAEERKSSFGDMLFGVKGSEQVKSGKQGKPDGERNSVVVNLASKKLSSTPPSLDVATKRRLLALMKDAVSSITLEEVKRKHKVPSTHALSSRNAVERNITLGKVEGSIEAVRTALRKLEEGCSTEDLEAVCAPAMINQIYKWKNKLRVYLAPFLHGMRYTSFGRHFTKVEKLEEIADRLHWYVKNGDTIVDFCCGANDFSIIMKKKLEETGKKCFYKNYDFIQPKNDFNFEKRDWMTVQPEELRTGSRLIMGLNPPFGVKAALANKFIDKALEFNPRILILIVPPETQRLNEKNSHYNLIWEDEQFLSGKSFYLPGSVDQNDKQMEQWNVRPPPLYLWSRPDWSAENKAIAREHGHISASPPGFHENIAKSTSLHHFPNSRRFHHNIPKFTNNF